MVATLSSNSVRVIATSTTADEVSAAVTGAGYRCRLVGQGDVTLFGDELALRLGTDIRTLQQSLAAVAEFKVGRCRLTVSKPALKAPMVSALETVTR